MVRIFLRADSCFGGVLAERPQAYHTGQRRHQPDGLPKRCRQPRHDGKRQGGVAEKMEFRKFARGAGDDGRAKKPRLRGRYIFCRHRKPSGTSQTSSASQPKRSCGECCHAFSKSRDNHAQKARMASSTSGNSLELITPPPQVCRSAAATQTTCSIPAP